MRESLCPLPQECIKVAVRVRPDLPGENNDKECIKVEESKGIIRHEKSCRTENRGRTMIEDSSDMYAFDNVWGKLSTQIDVFNQVQPLVDSAFEGYNATVFCHGPSGSGKTYTMIGSDPQPGIVPQALQRIFHLATQQEQRMLVVVLSVLELYNDQFYDILASEGPGSSASRKSQRQSTSGFGNQGIFSPPKAAKIEVVRQGKHSHIKGAYTRLQVDAAGEAMAEIENALRKRATAGTGMNDRSSRSHAIIMVQVQQATTSTRSEREAVLTSPRRRTTSVPFTTTVGTLYLVDLAGSERLKLSGVTGDGQKEAQHINKSLSALGNVLTALSKPHRDGAVIPYRDSKLTLLLQDALGGNSRTMMITCISALASLSQHTCVALQYAQRAKTITNSATKNLDNDKTSEIEGLKAEVEDLRRRLAERQVTALATPAADGMEEAVEKAKQFDRLRGVMEQNVREKRELDCKLEKVINGQFMSEEDDYTLLQAELESNLVSWTKACRENDEFKSKIAELQQKVESKGEQLESTRRESMALQQERQDLKVRNLALEKRVRELEQAAMVSTMREQMDDVQATLMEEEAPCTPMGKEDSDQERAVAVPESSGGIQDNQDEAVKGDEPCTPSEALGILNHLKNNQVPEWGLDSPFQDMAQNVLRETLAVRGAPITHVGGQGLQNISSPAGRGTPKADFLRSPHRQHLASPVGTPAAYDVSSPGDVMVKCLDTGERIPAKIVLCGVSVVPNGQDASPQDSMIQVRKRRSCIQGEMPAAPASKTRRLSTDELRKSVAESKDDEKNPLASIADKINTLRSTVKRASMSLNPFSHTLSS